MVAHGLQYQHSEDEAGDHAEPDSKKEMTEKTKGKGWREKNLLEQFKVSFW